MPYGLLEELDGVGLSTGPAIHHFKRAAFYPFMVYIAPTVGCVWASNLDITYHPMG